jgi:hypothetical protein
MKKAPDKKICILALAFIIIFGITNEYANGFATGSSDILLIGTFISPDEKGDRKTYELWTDEKKWRFTVTKARNMGPAGGSGWRPLYDISPRKIKLFGDERITAPLKQPEIVGKTFKLRGTLHPNNKTFRLHIVEEVMEKKSPEEEKKE